MSTIRVNQVQDTSTNVAANISGGVVTFTNPPQGVTTSRVLLQTHNISDGDQTATIGSSSTITSAYSIYEIEASEIRVNTNGQNVHGRISTNGTINGSAIYDSLRTRMYGGSASVSGYNYNNQIAIPFAIGESMSNSGIYYAQSFIRLYNPLNTSGIKMIHFDSMYNDLTPDWGFIEQRARIESSSIIVNGLTIYCGHSSNWSPTGTFKSGQMKLYGVN